MSTDCSVCCRPGITGASSRIFAAVPDVGTIGMDLVGLPLPLGPLNRHRRGIVILDRQGRRQSAGECSGRVGNLPMAFDRLEAAEQGGG